MGPVIAPIKRFLYIPLLLAFVMPHHNLNARKNAKKRKQPLLAAVQTVDKMGFRRMSETHF
ncbi:hypothetical protein P4518_16305, partial [Geobacillus thermodenitrificans]|nr:hypothetical protein [Geobacillus thermodenitrificans]